MAKRSRESELIADLKKATDQVKGLESATSEHERKKFRKNLEVLAAEIQEIAVGHDPIKRPVSVFDPTNPAIAGRLVAVALVAQPREKLALEHRFYGSGVYAIYYSGNEAAYRQIARTEHPIYVGKADPVNGHAKNPIEQGTKLFSRLQEHGKSIRNASNLDIADFECRFLVIATGWQKSAEEYLIQVFSPIWNSEVGISYGIGKHGDAAKTRANRRSPWDTMHPGRKWAKATITDQSSVTQIVEKIRLHFEENPPYARSEEILLRLLEDMKQLPRS